MRVAGVLMAVGLTAKFTTALPSLFGVISTQSSTLMQIEVFSKAALLIFSYQSAKKAGRLPLSLFSCL